MMRLCSNCGRTGEFVYVREYVDEAGRRWKLYRCPVCGHEISYAVV